MGTLTVMDTGEWRERQGGLDRCVAAGLALPFLHRYGYSLRLRR